MGWWIAGVVLGLYIVECTIWPYRRCGVCKGEGRLMSPMTSGWRTCSCGGDGQAIRWGRRVWEVLRRAGQ